MGNYKLIKKYPGSPKLGTIINYSEKHKVYNYNGGDYHTELPKHQVENLPEYWEKVEEKDYEIIAFKNTANDIIFEKCNDGYYSSVNNKFCIYDTKHFLSKDHHKIHSIKGLYKIHSIKRLSDGVGFRVGDEVIVTVRDVPQTIKQFEIDKGSIRFRFNDGCGALLKHFSDPEDIQHAEKPIFTTEDGVDIYEGETCYNVDKWSLKLYGPKEYTGNGKNKLKYFSTKETAEEYIKAHKPRYSRMDIGRL